MTTTKIHDSTTCTAGLNNQPCEMCQFTQNTSQGNSSLSEVEQGLKIDSSPSSASGISLPVPTFTQEWQAAPKWATRTTEEATAEWWFIRGQHAKEVEMLVEMNGDLRELLRVARGKARNVAKAFTGEEFDLPNI